MTTLTILGQCSLWHRDQAIRCAEQARSLRDKARHDAAHFGFDEQFTTLQAQADLLELMAAKHRSFALATAESDGDEPGVVNEKAAI